MRIHYRIISALAAAAFTLFPTATRAHVNGHPSIHDTVSAITDRMRTEIAPDDLRELTANKVVEWLTNDERAILGQEHILFSVNAPVEVAVIVEDGAEVPFWLKSRGFEREPDGFTVNDLKVHQWKKTFPAGEVGLGVNSLSGGGNHYVVTLGATNPGDTLEVSDLYPGQLKVAELKAGVRAYADRDDEIKAVPPDLDGSHLIQTLRNSRDDAKLVGLFRWTRHPSGRQPDQVVLTWSGDPKTTQTIQWRTSPEIRRGSVAYQEKGAVRRPNPRPMQFADAVTTPMESPNLINDSVIHRHTATLTGLKPGTTYLYSVGDSAQDLWTEYAEFTTAPDQTVAFSFNYMGDAQNGLDRWGSLARTSFRERPDAAFYLMAGDLVNRGAERDDWDSFFYNASGIFGQRQLAPVIGNHECHGGAPKLYLELFDLPKNGPSTLTPERAYSFTYSNALFVILDSNVEPETQVEWLEQQLAESDATWKFVSHHHPAYSSAPNRDNAKIRELWTPLFDTYHVDMVLQGHDHAYLRTHPMRDQKVVESAKDGTVYVVSVSGTKMYDQSSREYTAFGMTNVATYQVLDIQLSGDRLVYRAYDQDGRLRDEIVIQK